MAFMSNGVRKGRGKAQITALKKTIVKATAPCQTEKLPVPACPEEALSRPSIAQLPDLLLRKSEIMGYFMNQGLAYLVFNLPFGAAGPEDGLSKEDDMIRLADALEKTPIGPRGSLIESEKIIPLPESQVPYHSRGRPILDEDLDILEPLQKFPRDSLQGLIHQVIKFRFVHFESSLQPYSRHRGFQAPLRFKI
jgi:hypothetical protein